MSYASEYYGGGGTGATAEEIAAATIESIKADPQLGTADGGLVANAAASKAKTDLIGTVRSLIRW